MTDRAVSLEGVKLRRYNLSELDRMRAAIWIINHNGVQQWYVQGSTHDEARLQRDKAAVEDAIRTYMIAGINPSELEERAAQVKAKRDEEFAEATRKYQEREKERAQERLRQEYGPRG